MANCSNVLDNITCTDCLSGQRQCNVTEDQPALCFVQGRICEINLQKLPKNNWLIEL